MNRKEEKEKLLEEMLSKKKSYSTIYTDSMNILNQTENELNEILKRNQKEIEELTKSFNYSDDDINSLKKEIEKDFGVKVETPETVVLGKASKEVFDEITKELKERIIGQDEACELMSIAFRRPYVVGSNPSKIRNTVILYGSNGTGRHLLLQNMADLLKNHGLTVSNEVYTLDMSRYQSSSQDTLFLQDLYVGLTGKNPIILVENFEEASPVYNRMLNDLSQNGSCLLEKRYNLVNGQLQEANSKLTSEVIDSLNGNDKTLVFVSLKNPTKFMDYFGKSFVDNVADRVGTKLLSDEAVDRVIADLTAELILKCKTQLEINLTTDTNVADMLKGMYEPVDGIDSLSPVTKKIYEDIVDIALKNDEITEMSLSYEDNTLTARYLDKEKTISVVDDSTSERADIQRELDEIVGLESVKSYLLSLEDHIKVNQKRKQKGLKTAEISKHMIFTGNPGTGKTTIARLVSRMMKVCGILKQGQLVEVTRADLVGKYVGHTAPLTMSVIQSAMGGVLFIDEAYSLYRGKDDSFGLEAIDTLVKAMEDHRDDLIVILAGYTKEMETFLEANSGLKSRFANIIQFDDYTGEELMKISKSIAKGKDYIIAEECEEPLTKYFDEVQSRANQNSGNGRLARNLVEEAILKQSKRLLNEEDAEMNLLKLEDFNI